ncbi:MAG: SurA N-terminal domain-containing protein [Sphingomonadales bacterium]
MLSGIRKGLNSFWVLLLMGVLIASFAVWGIGDIFRTSGTTVLATVGDKEVTVVAFQRRLENLVRDNQARDPEFTRQTAFAMGLDRQLLNAMIQGAAVDAAAADLNIAASDDQIRSEVAALPAFQVAGNFDMSTYRFVLQQSGLTEKELFESIRQDLSREMLLTAVGQVAQAPATMANNLFRFLREKRQATIVTVPESAVQEVPTPDDETLEAYYFEHQERYQAPEYRSFDYGVLRAEDFADPAAIDEAALVEAFEQRRDEFVAPSLRRVEQVVFADQADAEAFAEQLAAGGDFAALAEDRGFAAEDRALGDLSRSDLEADYNAAVADAVFALDAGQSSAPVQSPFGWHVFKVTRVEAGAGQSLDDVREELRAALARERGIDRLYENVNAVEDAFSTGSTMAEALAAHDVTMAKAELVALSGAQKSGGAWPRFEALQPLLRDAFAQELGDEPIIVPVGDDAYGVVQVTAVEPARQLNFDEVRERVLADWQAQEKRRRNRALAEALLSRAEAGEDLAALANAAGYPIMTDIEMERQSVLQGGRNDGTAANILFDLRRGAYGIAPSSGGTAFMVVRNDRVEAADPASDPEYLTALRQGLGRVISTDLQQQYIAEQQRKHGVEVNERLWQSLREQLGAPS